MPKISINIKVEPEPGEAITDILDDLRSRFDGFEETWGVEYEDEPDGDGGDGTIYCGPEAAGGKNGARVKGWDARRADRLVRMLAAEARRGVRFILEQQRPEVPVADLLVHLELDDGRQLGGRMSSYGVSMRKMPQIPWPVNRLGNYYQVDLDIAPVILAALDRYAEQHAS